MTDEQKKLIEQVALAHGYSYEEVYDVFQKVLNVCVDVMEAIREVVNTFADWINEIRTRNVRSFNWNVPMDTTRSSQVRVHNVKLPRIRNLI